MVDVFSAIADPVRRNILTLLARRPAAAGVVADAFSEISRPAVSRHLRVLREAGLVHAEPAGRHQIYAASTAPLDEVSDWVDALAPRFIDHLEALKTEVYRTRRERSADGSPAQATETETDKEQTA